MSIKPITVALLLSGLVACGDSANDSPSNSSDAKGAADSPVVLDVAFSGVPGSEKTLEMQVPDGMKGVHQAGLGRANFSNTTLSLSFAVAPTRAYSRMKKQLKQPTEGQKTVVLEDDVTDARSVLSFRQDMLDNGKVVVSMYYFAVEHKIKGDYVSCSGMASKEKLQTAVAACKSLRAK